MTERPGSAGLFGSVPDRTPSVADLEQTIETHTGPVWRFIPSVTEADAQELGLMDRRRWEQVARQVLPETAKIMGIAPGNMQWVAAMHRKEGHPHLYILLWETLPTREQGRISERKLQDIHNLWMRELYRPQRQELGQEKTAIRQQARETAQAILNGDAGIHIPPPLLKALTEKLETLADHLPGPGRTALQYMPPAVKQEAHDTAQWLLQLHPDLAKLVARYGEIAAEMAQHYSDDPAQHRKARVNAQVDLTDRVSQILLQVAAKPKSTNTRWDTASRKRFGISRKPAASRPLKAYAASSTACSRPCVKPNLRTGVRPKRRGANTKEAWIDAARAHGLSEAKIAEMEMG